MFPEWWEMSRKTISDVVTMFCSVSEAREMVKSGVEYYDYLMSLGDSRVETWGLMSSPLPTIIITALYLLMCLRGPRLMSPFPALSLRPVVVIYNIFCAGLNLYIFLEIFLTSRKIQYSWTCQPVDYRSVNLTPRL